MYILLPKSFRKILPSFGSDIYLPYVFSLLPASGTNGSTSFPDFIVSRIWTPTNASITTSDSPFASGSSGNLGATGYLTSTVKNDWTFLHDGTTWTIDIWVKFNSVSTTQMIFATNAGSSANVGIGVWNAAGGVPRVFLTVPSTAANYSGPSGTFIANTWQLISLQFISNTFYMFVNGVFLASFGKSSNTTSAPQFALQIGASGGSTLPLNGKISNWRVTKGIARYPTNGTGFTLPTSPWPEV